MTVRRARGWTGVAVAGASAVLWPALGVATAAHAAGDLCDSGVVFDDSDAFDDASLDSAASAAFGDEVTVKVLAWDGVPGGVALFDAMSDAATQCDGWGYRPGGGRSLLVLGVATGAGELGSYYDGAAFDRFDDARDVVEVELMTPAFRDGAWTDGMDRALTGYGEAYDGEDPTVPGAGSGALPWALGVPAGLAAVGGAGYGAARLRRRQKSLAAARAGLGAAVGAMAQAWVELDEGIELVDARVAALPPVADPAADAVRAAHADVVGVRDAATATYLALAEQHTEGAVAELDADEATRATREVEDATARLREAQQAMGEVEARLSAHDALRAALPGRVEALRAAADVADGLLAARRAEGYRTTDNDRAPEAARRAADEVASLVGQQRFGDADAALTRAEADLGAHRSWLTGIAEFRAALVRDTADLRTRAAGLDGAVADAYVTTEALERDHDPTCVEGVRAAVDRAAAARTALEDELRRIDEHTTMADQRFALAREELTAAQESAGAIAADATVPGVRAEQLRALAAELPLRAERAVVECDAVQGRVTSHPAAMAFLDQVPDVAGLRARAAAVGEAAAGPRPPLLRLDDELREVEAALASARAVVDRGIADHQASRTALDGAAAALEAARGEVSQADVGPSARSLLEEAVGLLARAEEATTSLSAITSGADEARQRANAAAARARQDRRDAEQRRDAARRAEASRRRSRSSGGWSGGGSSRRSGGSSSRRSGGGSRSSRGGGSRRSGGGGSRKF